MYNNWFRDLDLSQHQSVQGCRNLDSEFKVGHYARQRHDEAAVKCRLHAFVSLLTAVAVV